MVKELTVHYEWRFFFREADGNSPSVCLRAITRSFRKLRLAHAEFISIPRIGAANATAEAEASPPAYGSHVGYQ